MDRKTQKLIVVRARGGLGNQMFQYALYKKYLTMNKEAVLNIGIYDEHKATAFTLQNAFPGIIINRDLDNQHYDKYMSLYAERGLVRKCYDKLFPVVRSFYYEREDGVYDENIIRKSQGIVDGYWQTSKYWKDIKDIIVNDFTFSNEFDCLLWNIQKIKRQSSLVSIHIRGGDYRRRENQVLYGNICTRNYYRKAIEYIKQNVCEPVFIVISNDEEIAHQTMEDTKVLFLKDLVKNNYPDWVEMMVMSECDHNIIANSTFSWWGAYLNKNRDKKIIAPSKWLNGKITKDIWEDEWIRIDE